MLENEGGLYREAVKRAELALVKKKDAVELNSGDKSLRDQVEQAEKTLQRERISASRLFAIDAGRHPDKLRERYSDRTRYIITKGVVEPGYRYKKESEEIFGQIKELSRERIHVPLNDRKLFDALLLKDKSTKTAFRPPRYQVELAYGRRFEPWIVSVQQLDHNP